jgi:NAD(P)-dependent dehydrogenase (short-subunit alcohol dehydrogenase family)
MTRLRDTTCVVTGANSGVGKAASRLLAVGGANVVMVCRDRRRGEAAQAEIRRRASGSDVLLYIADLSSLAAVRTVAEKLRSQFDRIDVLVNNAGVYRARREITDEGFERTLAVNHLAHFLLTHLLLEPLKAAAGRVINVSSEAHRSGDLTSKPLEQIIRGEGRYRGLQAYSDSKLANVLFTFELARRLENGAGVTTNALHPGVLATRIWNQNADPASLFMRVFKPFLGRPARGGEAVVRLATDPELEGVTGRYFKQHVELPASDAALDGDLAARLWDLSGELTGVFA